MKENVNNEISTRGKDRQNQPRKSRQDRRKKVPLSRNEKKKFKTLETMADIERLFF
jgi:hypothetical protein